MAQNALLQTIQTNLQNAKPSGTIPLDATTLTAAGQQIVKLFADQFGSPSVAFTSAATIDFVDDDTLRVQGAGSQSLLGIAAPAMVATLTTTPSPKTGAAMLELVLSITSSSWTLATTFPQLATTSLGGLSFAPGSTFFLRTADGPSDVYGVLEPAGLSLETKLTVKDVPPLSALDPILKLTQPTLDLAGPVRTSAEAETLSLRTGPSSSSFTVPVTGIAQLTLAGAAVSLTASATKGLADAWTTATSVEAWGAASLGGSAVVLSVQPPLGVAPWRLSVVGGLGINLSQVVGLVPGVSLIGALPPGVQGVTNANVAAFSFLLNRTNGSWTPQSLSIAVQDAAPWTIVPGAIALDRLGVALNVAFPAGRPQIAGGSVTGALKLGSGSGAVEVDTSIPIPLSSGEILVWSSPNAKLPGLGALAQLVGGGFAEALPGGFAEVGSFRLTRLAAAIDPTKPAITSVGIGLQSDPWTIVPNQLIVESIWTQIDVATPFSSPAVTGSIGGTIALGEGSDAPTASVAVQRFDPKADWILNANVENVELTKLTGLSRLTGGTDPGTLLPASLNGQSGMTFTLIELGLEVDLSAGTLDLLTLQMGLSDWQIAPGYFAVEQVTGALTIDWRSGSAVAYGFLQAVLAFGQGAAQLLLRAERDQAGGWTLSGTLTDDVDLIELVGKALGLTPPKELGKLTVSPLSLTYRTADDSYDFNAAAKWTPSIQAVQFELDASVELHRKPVASKALTRFAGQTPAQFAGGTPTQFAYSGAISADLSAHFSSHALALSVGYVFQTQNSRTSYVFGLKYDELSLTGTYTKGANGDEIVTVRLGGVTFGGIVTYLVNLVDPDLHFSLSAPWDVLNKISFDNLSLTINLTQRSVGITYAAKQNLGLIDIETIGLTYLRKGGSATVDIQFTGSFLGQTYTPDQPLGWDLLNESPPTPSGQGSSLFDLRLLGIGQHLVLADPHADTMAKVIDDLDQVVKQTKDSPKPWELLKFDPSAGWLFAADFTVMDTLTLRLVFDDPVLYGVEISLAGSKAGPFAGLDFQILYRKLSDSLGVYHIALTLPDVMRHLEFGEVSITLPDVIVDIYTDGSFYLDFGFPYNNDWTVCFGVQVFPFVGAGGFYFGKLSTAAAAGTNLVPSATNGTFGPVIEFGLALALGVGKTISEGPLSAGVSVTVQGIVTGVVSWFNPTDGSQGSVQYYKIEGSVAVVGQLYGRVDFKIITIDVSIVATATVSLTVECYQPILLGLSLDVEVHASIKIVFFTIHFSFGLHLDASFTIGSAQATPWHLASASGGSGASTRSSLAARRRVEHPHRRHAGPRALLSTSPASPALSWPPVAVLGATQVPIDVELVPLFTPAANGGPTVKIVMGAFVQTSSAAGAAHDQWRAAVASEDKAVSEIPFNVIAEAMLKWGMNTLIAQFSGAITAVDLQLIYEDLCRADIGTTGFRYTNVTDFLDLNIQMTLVSPPSADGGVARAALPMLPPLQMAAPDLAQPVKFWEAPQVGTDYQNNLVRLADQLKVNFDYSRADDPVAKDEVATTPADGDPEPITEALFGDWFLMTTRAVVQSARSLLADFPLELTGNESLSDLAATYAPSVQYTMREDDTFPSIAELFGITATQLVDANPGQEIDPGKTLTVPPPMAEVEYVTVPGDTVAQLSTAWHTTAQAIAAANPGIDVHSAPAGTAIRIPVPEALLAIVDANLGAKLASVAAPISGLRYQVRAGDTLGAIASAYHLPDADAVAEPNATDPTVLQTGATLDIAQNATSPPSIPYQSAAGDTLATLAAMLLVRNQGSVEAAYGQDPSYNWIVNAIPAYNSGVVFSALPAGVALEVPNVVLGEKGLEPSVPTTVPYTTKASDTLPLIAASFLMAELRPADPDLVALQNAIKSLNPTVDWTHPLPSGTALTLPAQAHQLAAGDTLKGLADRFWVTVRDLALVNGAGKVLSPTATLTLPAGMPVAGNGQTLSSLAAALGLSVDQLVGRIGARQGILTAQQVKIPHARQYDVDELMALIVSSGEANSAAGQASSFLLAGLRAPDPGAPGKDRALYDLTAQQFSGPQTPQNYQITFTAPNTEKWFTLPGGQVQVTITQDEMQQSWPSTTLDPQLRPGYPATLPLARARPVRYPVGTPIPWSPPAAPPLFGPPPPAGGGPVLFPLPASAIASATRDGTPHQYELDTVAKGSQDDPTPVPTYAWATWVPFTVRRVPAAGGGWVPGAYVAVGADQTGVDVLLSLWTHLQSSADTATLTLAYQTASGTGLVSDALGPGTALLKVNLSTETHSPPAMLMSLVHGTIAPATYALLSQAQQFVQLLWEATITGTGGFYLTYDTTSHGPLSDAAFAAGDDAQLFLMATLDGQTKPPGNQPPDRTLHAFTTGALVEGNLDPSRLDIFAQASDGSDMKEVAVVPPGNVGYVLDRTNPSPGSGALAAVDPIEEDRTRALYSMLAFDLSGDLFKPPDLVFPKGPVTDQDPSVWHYDRTIPVFRLAKTPAATLPAALPVAKDDPYVGVAAGSQVTLAFAFRDRFGNELGGSTVPSLPVDVGYTDPVLGLSAWPSVTGAYAIAGPDGAAKLTLDVDLAVTKYVPSTGNLYAAAVRTASAHRTTFKQIFFQLRRPDVWTSVSTSLDAPGTPCLASAQLKPQLLGLVTASYVYLGAAAAVGQGELPVRDSPPQSLEGQAQDLFVSVQHLAEANAGADASALFSGPLTIPVLRVVRPSDTLGTLAGAAALPVSALLDQNENVPLKPGAVLQTAVRTYTTAADDTLTMIGAILETTPALLATANSGTSGLLQAQTVTLGNFQLQVTGSDTFATLANKLSSYDPTITVPGTGELLANVAGLFAAQKTIAIASSPVAPDEQTGARTCTVGQSEALVKVAERVGCTPLGLALANCQRAGVLEPTASVDVEGVTVPVGTGGTILSVTLALRAKSLTVGIAEVTAAIQERTDLLVQNAQLAVVDHVVMKGETIATVPALAVPVLSLFDSAAPPNVFATGTALTVASSQYRPQPGDTMAAIAADNGLELDQLAFANGVATLSAGAPVAVPGGMTLGNAPVPYQVAFDAVTPPTISAVASTFGIGAAEIGTLNADMPGLFLPGISIAYPGHPVTTTPDSTLASLAAEAGVAVDVFTAEESVADKTGLVATGALFACPPPPVEGSIDDMAGALGVQPLDLAAANSALMGLVTAGHKFVVTVQMPPPATPVVVNVTSGPNDTLQTVLRRVQATVPTATLADLVSSCGGDAAALVQKTPILVPPAAVSVESALTEPVHLASTFSPLDVTLTVARDEPAMIDPEFRKALDVVRNDTAVAPGLGDPPTLVPFAAAFEGAFTTRRLKLATGPQSAAGTPQLWVVDFGAGGIGEITVQGEAARFYTVAPVSRVLAGGQASIKPYDPESGKLGPAVEQTIASADLDSWMRIALGAIDLVLSPAVAAAAWRQEPSSLNSLVASKQTIAGALRDRVAEILSDDSPDDAGLASAQEALYQTMLVSLAAAYATDAVITYPVTVESPFTATYTTGPNDGFSQLAAAYGLSPEGVAEGLADVPSILAEVTVSINGRTYPISADETLRTLALAANVDVGALPDVLSLPSNTPLFVPDTTLKQSAMVRKLAAGDTFWSLGEFFGTDPGSVGVAAQLIAGLVPDGQTIVVDGAQYTVQKTDTLVAIAAALSHGAGHSVSVPAVVEAPGVIDNPAMLSTNANVHCFSPGNLIAPRLSGKATAEQYQVQAGDGMDALVAWYEVSLEALADALAQAQILNAGTAGSPVSASWSGHSATIAPTDTLTTLASALGAPDVLTMLAGLTIAPAGQGLLRPGTRIPLGRVTTTPTSGDSFASLAAYFEDDPGSFAVANQDRRGLLVAGTKLALGGRTYQVGANDSLVDVAKGLGTTPGQLAVAPVIGDQQGIFTPSPVYDLQVLPEFSLSTAKAPLLNGTSHVSFLFGTNADATFKSLFLDVDYDVAELEVGIRNVAAAGDYQASEWLRLVVPFGTTAFGGAVDLSAGQTQVPIPLRAFPLLPSVVDLAADAAWPTASTIAEVKQWQLMAAVQHQSAAQDEIQLQVAFGRGTASDLDAAPQALFDALGGFVTAWPLMQTDVAALAAAPAGAIVDKLQQLVESLATLAGDLATALTKTPPEAFGDDASGQLYEFRLEPTIDHAVQPPVLELFDLVLVSATETQSVPWPTVYLTDPADPLRRTAQTDGTMRYLYADGAKPTAFASLTQHYVFPGDTPGRDAVAFQNGQVAAAVQRNADLVTTASTAERFLYQTPWVSFTAAAVPFLQSASAIKIGAGGDLETGITNALTELLTLQGQGSPAPGPYLVRLLLTYERILAGANGAAPIAMSLPVVYVPQWTLAGTGIDALAGDIAAQAAVWSTNSGIEQHSGDAYVCDLSIFATADTALTRPLVETSRLLVSLA